MLNVDAVDSGWLLPKSGTICLMNVEFNSPPSLEEILKRIWSDLAAGVSSARDPFHTPAVSTLGPAGPEVRTVVLRGVNEAERELLFNTDTRSPKYAQLLTEPVLSWLFYDRDRKIQLRASGACVLHRDDQLARQSWQAATDNSRWCYTTSSGPSSPVPRPDAIQHDEEGFQYFSVVSCKVERFDWLYLRAGGHLRSQFAWNGSAWDMQWLAP